jgi:hypothetical protein
VSAQARWAHFASATASSSSNCTERPSLPAIGPQSFFVSLDTSFKADKEKGYFTLLDVVVKPTKPIEGTIRAKDTRKPLAGVVVYGGEAWNLEGFRREVRAITDTNGHYRLVGMPKAARPLSRTQQSEGASR